MSGAAPDRVLFHSWLQQYSLSAFINLFLHIKFRGKVLKWTLFPLQQAMCQAITAAASVRESVFWLLKARQVGGTEIIAAWCLFMCLSRPGYSILVLSKTGGAAQDFIEEKLLPMLDRLYEYVPHLPWPSYTRTKSLIRFSNGSRIEAINSANHAGRGKTVDAVVMDEAGAGEFEHHAEDIFQSVQGTTEHGSSAFMVVMGTSAPGTWFNNQSEEFYRHGAPGVTFFFLSMAVFPWRDTRTPEGKAWWAKRVAQLGEVGARQEYPSTPEDAFLSKSGFVFPQFERPAGRHIKRMPLDWTQLYLIVYDHGRTEDHPAILWHCHYYRQRDHLHVFKEEVWQGEGLNKICADMVESREELKKLAAAAGHALPKPNRQIADTAITNDDGREKSIRDVIFQKTKYYFTGARKHDKKVSLDFFIARINEDKFSMDPDCVFSANQISHLLWSKRKSQYGTPEELGDDAPDLGRYACAEIEAQLKRKPQKEAPIKPYSREGAAYRAQHSITKAQVPPADPGRRYLEY
ncbi:MAG TPA: phage terminase large subunit family protein [Fibrobacteria bacterium]|nr:phage terminase large subunit family protein [Fibrobacteria bacterium]